VGAYTAAVQVLVVDDHSPTRQLVQRGLEQAFHGVTTVASCEEAEDAVLSKTFDVVVLDVMLPDGSGIDLCRRLRRAKRYVPILLLTARGDVRDRVAGLEAGADDYLVKPFAVSELTARVKALGRRGPLYREEAVAFGPVIIDFEARRVSMNGREVPLTAKELAIVEVLAWRQRSVVSRDQLLESVWGEVSDSAAASLEVLITRIRRKLGPSATLLKTVRGVGYTFRCDP
jgi:two-component system, OmpR family, response regulator